MSTNDRIGHWTPPSAHRLTVALSLGDLEATRKARLACAVEERDHLREQLRGAVDVAEAARVYFREFDHLIGVEDYPERADLREALARLAKAEGQS